MKNCKVDYESYAVERGAHCGHCGRDAAEREDDWHDLYAGGVCIGEACPDCARQLPDLQIWSWGEVAGRYRR